jgi:hypothetical protein
MKNTIYIGLFAVILLFSSCENALDSIVPKDKIAQSTLTVNDIDRLRNGVYNEMEDFVWSVYFDFDIKGENFKAGPGFSLIDPVSMIPAGADVDGIWKSAYSRLRSVNFMIETLDELNDPKFATVRGEMYYFRALIYYNMVTRWGGVPILKKRTYDVVQRSTEQEVWDFIISDLQVSESNIGDFVEKWYASKPAAYGLMAKVYLAQKNNVKVIEYCNKVIALNKFVQTTSATEYATMFVASSTSKEVIFGLLNNNSTNKHLIYQKVNDVDGTWEYSADASLFTSLYADYTIGGAAFVGDKRKTAVFSADANRIIKFPNGKTGQQLVTTTNADYTPLNVLRYSEILLMKAEAQGAGVDAAATLKPYFVNRYTTSPSEATLAALNATDFQNLILNERRKEFFGEGQRWYDLKRTGRTDLLTSLNGRNFLLYYPVHQSQKDIAGYTQNDGY